MVRLTDAPLVGGTPDTALATMATLLGQLLHGPVRTPARWMAPAFVREVELVRTHLRVIRTSEALAASFAREAFHGGNAAGALPPALGAVAVGYAIRWLELADGSERPAWATFVAARDVDA